MYVSLFHGLSLGEYTTVRETDCRACHVQPCSECSALLKIAFHVLKEGYCLLSEAFRMAFPHQTYKADIAIQRILQMPVAAICVGTPQSGRAIYMVSSRTCGGS